MTSARSARRLRQLLINFLPGLSLLLLSACGQFSNTLDPAALTSDKISDNKSGVILITTGADSLCVSFSTFLYLTPTTYDFEQNEIAKIQIDAYINKSVFKDHFGLINAIAVPAGTYHLVPWINNPYVGFSKEPTYDITVNAGEIVYVGEYRQPGRCARGRGVISNQWVRDRPLFAQSNPNIDMSKVKTRLMVLGKILN